MRHRALTYELVTSISRQFSSRFEFQRGDKAAYNKALKEGWLDSYTWLTTPVLNTNDSESKVHVVYAYLDEENKVVYIGRTNNLQRRHRQHNNLMPKSHKYDVVKTYFMSVGLMDKLPEPVILEEGLNMVESQEKEGFYINEYANQGWYILNTGKAGANISSVGSFIQKWTYENCKELALTCESRQEFKKKSSAAYAVSRANKWIDEWLPISPTYHKAENSWTKELCIEIAKKYTSFTEFSRKEPRAFTAAQKRGWQKEFYWLKRSKRKNITKEEIVRLAQDYNHASDFKRDYPYHYNRARRMGILSELSFTPKDTRKWTYETCHEEAMKYSSQIEFRKNNPSAYDISLRNGWINDWLPKTNIIRSDEELLEEARKFKTINEMRRSNDSLYCLILKRGLLGQTGLQYLRKQWTEEKVREEASLYQTRQAFNKGSNGAYNYAKKHKLLDELFPKIKLQW